MRAAIWVFEADSVVVRVRVSGDWWKSLKGGGGARCVVGGREGWALGGGFWGGAADNKRYRAQQQRTVQER